jgi:hypothetical protein
MDQADGEARPPRPLAIAPRAFAKLRKPALPPLAGGFSMAQKMRPRFCPYFTCGKIPDNPPSR